ncbi:Eco57I restriction-modification methylase domain-containing protein [Prosthecobacter sp.]|uniref:Eco57I restriction-modification methylase domain-containing protein n=1 Tax=Prosthecobacter sp. TaxID=1965333 RepID=UPI0037847664
MSLQPLLRQPYVRDTYRTILEDILPSGTLQILQSPQVIIATCDFVTGTHQIGSIELPDGSTIALLEVQVADQIKLARNRVALRNFVARFIDEASTTAVLAVFHQPGQPDWRLTYACKRSQMDDDTLEITSTQTAPRRYTFLLGQNEPCKTAAGRLAELREKGPQLTLEDIEKAFSVERLNKDFFKQYKEHYEKFVSHLLSPEKAKATRAAFGIATHKDKAEQDKADKPVRDFVKRLLGRLVFLHFLQKKGWMGCKAGGKSWTGGDADFLASYFALAASKKQADQFHSRWLIPLFFEALNQPDRAGDVFPPTGTRIPYLNGGLFETDPAPLHALDFPAHLFSTLLEFFGQYHFTIDENDPEDHEVGIDPEMLGHIFENLLEDNKDKGAYYTPKAIVAYMARQSLLHYLQTHLGENAELSVLLNEKDFTRLEKNGFVHQHAKRIAELLDAVKICDPAIGSGAFPIGLLQEILWTRLALNLELNTPEERAKLKRRIIQNSIHGVDLDPGAVEIARLRFWLALVVDEDQPRPLPNLDYKIHRADSLIEYIRGEPVHLGKVNAADKRTHGAIQSLIAAKAALFTAQKLPEKRAARFALYRALAEVAMAEFTWLRNEMGLIAGDAERAAQLDNGLKEFSHRLELINNAAKLKAEHQDRRLDELRAWFDDDQKPTFLWQLHFGEVFANGGFDIVIANPPYGATLSPEQSSQINHRYEVASGSPETFAVFLELATILCREKGHLCFIVPTGWYSAPKSSALRRHLAAHSDPTFIVLLPYDVFEDAWVDTTIFGAFKRPTSLSWPRSVKCSVEIKRFPRKQKRVSLSEFFQETWTSDFISWFSNNSDEYLPNASPIGLNAVKRMRQIGKNLSDFADIQRGVTPFHLSKQPPPKNSRRAFNGELRRYRYNVGEDSFIQYDNTLAEYKPEKYFVGHRILLRELISRQLRLQACLVETDFITNKSMQSILVSGTKHEAWFTLSILNSAALSWYFLAISNVANRDDFPKIVLKETRQLPIPPAKATDKARLSQLAEACAAAAQRGDDETLAVLEAEIDEIVYRLFDLTEEEIALIESALAPTRGGAPARKRSRANTPAATAYELPPPSAETLVQETPPAPPPASAPAWLPGELFNVEGELPVAKKARAAPEAAIPTKPAGRLRSPEGNARTTPEEPKAATSVPVDETERADVLAVIREVFSSGGERDRETARREIAQKLGYERVGSRIREVLDRDIRTAVRRGILQNEGGQLSLHCRSIDDYDRTFLKELFLAAINQNGKVWLERYEAIRLFSRWLGFRRTGHLINEQARSLINGLLRDGSLEKDGQDWIRRT